MADLMCDTILGNWISIYYEFHAKLNMISASFKHCTHPSAKTNATKRCPMMVGCCVSFF